MEDISDIGETYSAYLNHDKLLYCNSYDKFFHEEANTAIKSLNPYEFAFFDNGLNDFEKSMLSKINIQKVNTFNQYGKLEALHEKATKFIQKNVLKPEDALLAVEISRIISKLALNIISLSDSEDAQVSLATYLENESYFPFWHVDKNQYELLGKKVELNFNEASKVFLCALKGETTLYQKVDFSLHSKFNSLANDSAYVFGYSNFEYFPGHELDKLFSVDKAVSPNLGECSVHLSGYNWGTIHATPTTKERLVLLIIPGKKEIVEELGKHILETNARHLKELGLEIDIDNEE